MRFHPDLPCGGSPHRCDSCQTNKNRTQRKRQAVQYAGGKCVICGYDRCLRALVFHHTDPEQKEYGIGGYACCSPETLRDEIDKCVLLCSNCHAEVHEGVAVLPAILPPKQPEFLLRNPIQKRAPAFCADCGKKVSFSSIRCQRCESLMRRGKSTKIVWPPLEKLLALLATTSRVQVARQLGVSDTAVRKHIMRLQAL